MLIIRRLKRLYRSLLLRPTVEAEMEAEMRHHLELEAEELMRSGMPASDAQRQAALRFGGVQQRKEEALEDGSLWWLDGLKRDIRISTRTLLRHPSFAITATLALALAIGVNTTMFSVLDAMINPTIGARRPEQLFGLRYYGNFGRRLGRAATDRALAAGGTTYSAFTGSGYYPNGGVVERGDVVRQTDVIVIRPNFFGTLGIAPVEGTLAPANDRVTGSASLIISDRLRAELFGEGESPIGKSILVDGSPYKVLGVAKRYGASSSLNTDIWMFAPVDRDLPANLIRLRNGVTLREAEREFSLLASRIALGEGEAAKDARFALTPFTRQFEVQRFHYALIGAGVAVLLVACMNLANLQLARGLGRASEIALRSALGASRRHIVTQLMIESGVLAAGALVLAVLLALAGNALLHATIPPKIGAYVVEPQSSWRMVLFASVAAVLSLALVGLAPAIRVSRVNLNSLLKSRAGTGAHRSNRRTYGALVITQIALTLPLVCAAVLLARSAVQLGSAEYRKREQFGFDTRPLILATFLLPPSPDAKIPIAELAANLVSKARGLPNVTEAAVDLSRRLPKGTVAVDDNDGDVREINAYALGYQIVSPSYFRTMGLPIERGHDFPEGGHTEPLIVMDRGTGWYLWPRSAPIGRSMKLGELHSDAPWIKVTGIVGDSLSEDARQMRRMIDTLRINQITQVMTMRDSEPASRFTTFVRLYVRARRDPQRVASQLRQTLHLLTIQPPRVQLFEEYRGIPGRVAVQRFIAGIFTMFGLLALGLSALGVYGIVAQSVTDRKREVAVRIALGATPRNIVRALIREGNVLVLAGVAIGLYMTTETIGWLGSFLVYADTENVVVFGALCVALFCAMVLSALIPAFRATKLDPMEVLRAE